ncbi:MAG: hypothetical protein ABSG93_03110 [Solirubrobacteraceae bacterium]
MSATFGMRPSVYRRRRMGALVFLVALILVAAVLGPSLGRSEPSGAHGAPAAAHGVHTRRAVPPPAPAPTRPAPAPQPSRLLVSMPAATTTGWSIVAEVRGQPAAWLAQRAGVTLMRFKQRLLHLNLHAGSLDGGVSGWTYGDQITPREIHLIVAAFNGGFKLSYPNVGFMSGGHVAVPLKPGLASIVTYTDGTTDIGAWHAGVPSAHQSVFSVLQNQQLLVDRGLPAVSTAGCVIACWGGTVEGRMAVARSGLGVTSGGQLVWAAGERLLPSELAAALVDAGAVRAIELDINPDWVAGYLYIHHPSGPAPTPVVPGQLGIAGELLEPDTRDFLTIVAN